MKLAGTADFGEGSRNGCPLPLVSSSATNTWAPTSNLCLKFQTKCSSTCEWNSLAGRKDVLSSSDMRDWCKPMPSELARAKVFWQSAWETPPSSGEVAALEKLLKCVRKRTVPSLSTLQVSPKQFASCGPKVWSIAKTLPANRFLDAFGTSACEAVIFCHLVSPSSHPSVLHFKASHAVERLRQADLVGWKRQDVCETSKCFFCVPKVGKL